MRRLLDGLAGVVAADVARDFLGPRDEADGGGTREQRQRAADVRVRNRVAVAVEAHVRGLAGRHGAHHVGLEGMRGQRQEPRLLLGEDLRDGLIAQVGMRTLMRDRRRASAETAHSDRRHRQRSARQRRHAGGTEFGARSCPSHFRGRAYTAGGRSDNGRRAPGAADESESRCPAVPARHCGGCRRPGSARRPETRRKASTCPRRKLSSVWSSVKSAHTAREYDSTITKPESERTPWPIRIEPKAPQSTWASSPSASSGGDRPWAWPRGGAGVHDPTQLDDRAGVAAGAHHLKEPRRAQPRILGQRVADERADRGRASWGGTCRVARACVSCAIAARTVSWWTPRAAAMVPTFQCSPK